jgi:protein SCO1
MKTCFFLMAAFIAGSVALTPFAVWAHEGHDHGAPAQAGSDPLGHEHHAQGPSDDANIGKYARSSQVYLIPDLTLVNAEGRPIRVRQLLAADGPVILDFIFTTCTKICPEMSKELSAAPKEFEAAAAKLRMISVSIDPENDTPAQLKTYAGQFRAGANWQFLTGSREDIETMKQAFDIDHGDKQDVEALTFLRPAAGKPWVRINGFASAVELAREYSSVVSK